MSNRILSGKVKIKDKEYNVFFDKITHKRYFESFDIQLEFDYLIEWLSNDSKIEEYKIIRGFSEVGLEALKCERSGKTPRSLVEILNNYFNT